MRISSIRVKNMASVNGNLVPNQFTIRVKTQSDTQVAFDSVYFQSYDTIVAVNNRDGITLDKDSWDYSRTTSKYLYQFLRHNTGEAINCKKDVKSKIKQGIYKLANLN